MFFKDEKKRRIQLLVYNSALTDYSIDIIIITCYFIRKMPNLSNNSKWKLWGFRLLVEQNKPIDQDTLGSIAMDIHNTFPPINNKKKLIKLQTQDKACCPLQHKQ